MGDGWGRNFRGWDGWVLERAYGRCTDGRFAFNFVLLYCPIKVRNENCEQGCEGKSI